MKKKTKQVMGITGAGILVVSGLATGGAYLMSNQGSTPNEMTSASEKLPVEEQEALVTNLIEMTNSGYRPTEIEAELRKHIDQLDKEASTRMVRELMTSINTMSTYFGQLLYYMGSEIEYTSVVDELDNPLEKKEDVSNELVKGFFNEAERQHLELVPLNGYFYIEPDADYVLQKYGTYIHGDYKDYLNLAAKQQTDPIFNEEAEMYDVDRLKEDIEYIDNSRDRWSEGEYADDFNNMEVMLYEALFNLSHTTFFDMTIENEGEDNEEFIYTLKDDIREKYESMVTDGGDTTLSKEVESFLNVLKENNYHLNDKVDAFLQEFFADKFNVSEEGVATGSLAEEKETEK